MLSREALDRRLDAFEQAVATGSAMACRSAPAGTLLRGGVERTEASVEIHDLLQRLTGRQADRAVPKPSDAEPLRALLAQAFTARGRRIESAKRGVATEW